MRYNRGTEMTLNNINTLNVVVGSIDKNNPKSIYIRFSGWGNPIKYSENNDYKTIIRNFDKKIRTNLYNNLTPYFIKGMTLVDLDMRDSGIIKNKSSFMSCEITLYQLNNYSIDSNELSTDINQLIKIILKNVFEDNQHFKFFKKKKSAKESFFKA